jgi:hypothetical protein
LVIAPTDNEELRIETGEGQSDSERNCHADGVLEADRS